ncbi:hypothetical protein NLJ89_g10170 [Agrocybe chaxingu]|uniref:protein-histidine N-methyltransferase n=1 Tax=Agrocybe chaxingu TaxID=84603 RepID=A0A9W8JYN8_9AGAR|nr:hypothetical protein NLJ89_g10170 [Agrocybe chaxingu]
MFKFDFDIEDAEDLDVVEPSVQTNKERGALDSSNMSVALESFAEVPIVQLLDILPSLISYSPLRIPLSSSRKELTLLRRDLFDARFQLISEGVGDGVNASQILSEEPPISSQLLRDRKALDFLDAPSDLVPGVYEGGLKTWECSLDLVDYLDTLKDMPGYDGFEGKKVLELGCGTGVPSLYILYELLSAVSPSSASERTEIHLQDYNQSVLQFVTLPNLLLTWYASPLANDYRASINDPDIAPLLDPTVHGELPITPELKAAFLSSFNKSKIAIRLFSGSWDTFDPFKTIGTDSYDILLTSETVYRTDSLLPLVNLMRAAVGMGTQASDREDVASSERPNKETRGYLCLVAAKVLYFGVGGGIPDFLETLKNVNADVETVLERTAGVGRKTMRVRWY